MEGVIFLGTPHSGTNFAQYGIYAATLFIPFDSDANIIRLLIANNVILKDLDDEFQGPSLIYHQTTFPNLSQLHLSLVEPL